MIPVSNKTRSSTPRVGYKHPGFLAARKYHYNSHTNPRASPGNVCASQDNDFITGRSEARQRILPTWPVPPGITISSSAPAFAYVAYCNHNDSNLPRRVYGFLANNTSDKKKRFRESNSQTSFASGSKAGWR